MSIIVTALALASAAPAAAPAQTAPATAPAPAPAPAKKECCCEKMERPMPCCDKHGEQSEHPEGGSDPHAGHNMNQ
ncbi:MAG TPA: hypothetical protein VIT45_05120 [Allosphingosinicella sp.]